MEVKGFFDALTWTVTYVAYDAESKDAVVIDPVLDYDAPASRVYTESTDSVIEFCKVNDLNVRMILETHAHADHLSGSQAVKRAYPDAEIAISARIVEVQTLFKTVFDLPADFPTDGRQFDRLLGENEVTTVGTLEFETIYTPGHTPACASFKFEDTLFTGDALFMPDSGLGRCDFPGGSAESLYDSVTQRLYQLPAETRVFVGHDYQPGGREVMFETTVGAQRESNVHLKAGTSKDDFVAFRSARDKTLSAPKLLFQSVQVNVDAGKLPEAHGNEVRYLKIPINVFKPQAKGEVELRDL